LGSGLGIVDGICSVAAWLLSDYASYVNGAEVAVDGAHLAGAGNHMIGR